MMLESSRWIVSKSANIANLMNLVKNTSYEYVLLPPARHSFGKGSAYPTQCLSDSYLR